MRGPAMMPSIYCALEAERRPAHVANGGEAAHQRIRRLVAGREVGKADVAHRLCRGGRNQHRVPVRIDQPRHQRSPVAGDALCACGLDGLRRDARDHIALDQHVRRSRESSSFSVEDADVFEKDVVGARGRAKSEHESGRKPMAFDRPARRLTPDLKRGLK